MTESLLLDSFVVTDIPHSRIKRCYQFFFSFLFYCFIIFEFFFFFSRDFSDSIHKPIECCVNPAFISFSFLCYVIFLFCDIFLQFLFKIARPSRVCAVKKKLKKNMCLFLCLFLCIYFYCFIINLL